MRIAVPQAEQLLLALMQLGRAFNDHRIVSHRAAACQQAMRTERYLHQGRRTHPRSQFCLSMHWKLSAQQHKDC